MAYGGQAGMRKNEKNWKMACKREKVLYTRVLQIELGQTSYKVKI